MIMSHKLKIRSKLSKIDLKFINQANEIKNLSLAEDKKVGAIIANHKNGEILAIGYNKMFDDLGFQNCEDETGQSLPYVIHAEEIAVIEFLKKDISNIDLSELTLYCSYSACINCAKLIQHAGIKRFLFTENYHKFKKGKHSPYEFLLKMNVEVIEYNINLLSKNNREYLGIGEYNSKHKSYSIWKAMLQRCYNESFLKIRPSYIGCSVVDEWHNFQIFAKWYEDNYIEGFVLDKDILFKNNKIYGPDTCCFVPSQINQLFTKTNKLRGELPIGVCFNGNNYLTRLKKFGKQINLGTYKTIQEAFDIYKIQKEIYIREVAEIWKDKIPNNVYQALMNYNVEITD